jgi:hypothetical protein
LTKRSDYQKQEFELAIWAERVLYFVILEKIPSDDSNQFRLIINEEEIP